MLSQEDYRKLAESTEISTNGKPIGKKKLPLPLIIGGAMTAMACIWLLGGETNVNHRLTEPEREQFYTGSFIPPQLPEEKEQRIEADRVEIQPEPDIPPPPPPSLLPIIAPIMPPPIETMIGEDDSAKWERLRLPMIVFSQTVEKNVSDTASAVVNTGAADNDAKASSLTLKPKRAFRSLSLAKSLALMLPSFRAR